MSGNTQNINDTASIKNTLTNVVNNIQSGNIEEVASSIAPLVLQKSQNVMPPNPQLEEISISMSSFPIDNNSRNSYIVASTMRKVRKQRQLHRMCSQYYERINSLINLPAIAISGAATVYSFAYPSDSPQEQVFINKMIAGSLSALNTILFSVSCFLKLQAKAESHFIAAEEYDNLLTMINFELRFPSENIQEFTNKVEKKILEIKKSCRYFPPDYIIQKYDTLNPQVEGDDSSTI